MITAPGIYAIPAAEYHADPCPSPSLSNSIAQVLLDQSPRHAWLAHPKLGGGIDQSTRRMDLGTIAHAMLLGQSGNIVVIYADDYRTKAAQQKRDDARAANLIPALVADVETATQMSETFNKEIGLYSDIVSHWLASQNEQVVVWQESGIWCRAMIDATDLRMVFDYKSVGNAQPDAVARHIYHMKYHRQAAWYLRGLDAVDPDGRGRRRFVFIAQEIDEPHAVTFHEVDATAMHMAQREIESAIAIWRECVNANHWPAYHRMVYRAAMPTWMETRQLEREIELADRPVNMIAAG